MSFTSTDAASLFGGQVCQQPVGERAIRDHDVGGGERRVEKFRVSHFYAHRGARSGQHASSSRDGHDVALTELHVGREVLNHAVATELLDEYPRGREGCLDVVHAAASRPNAVGAAIPFMKGRDHTDRLRLRHRRFEGAALRREVESEEPRRQAREEPHHKAGAHQIADGVRDGDVVQQPRLFSV